MKVNYHKEEAIRIQKEIDSLDDSFKEDGIVKFVLKKRVEQELRRSKGEVDESK